jgi:hypothetical protein
MDTILVSVVSLALIIISTLTMTFTTFQSTAKLADAWKELQKQSDAILQTNIRLVMPENYRGGQFTISVVNDGNANLSDYEDWDALVQYESGASAYLTYTETYPPAAGQWTMTNITMQNGTAEAFDPHILNPGEQMAVTINPSTDIADGQSARVIVSTPNGRTSQGFVTRTTPIP